MRFLKEVEPRSREEGKHSKMGKSMCRDCGVEKALCLIRVKKSLFS